MADRRTAPVFVVTDNNAIPGCGQAWAGLGLDISCGTYHHTILHRQRAYSPLRTYALLPTGVSHVFYTAHQPPFYYAGSYLRLFTVPVDTHG